MREISISIEQRKRLSAELAIDLCTIEAVIAALQIDAIETVEDFVLRRHGEMQEEKKRNDEIFTRIKEELPNKLFVAKSYSIRQIRRIIYG